MITIVCQTELHDNTFPVYVFSGKILKQTINVNPDNLAKEVLSQYLLNNADKIILGGNDLLTYHYEQKIREVNSTEYHFKDLNIERTTVK